MEGGEKGTKRFLLSNLTTRLRCEPRNREQLRVVADAEALAEVCKPGNSTSALTTDSQLGGRGGGGMGGPAQRKFNMFKMKLKYFPLSTEK